MFQNLSGKQVSTRPTVSVIIPTLDEGKNLPLVLSYIPMDVVDEVILVDGRSQDNTVKVARELMPSIKVVFEMTPGKGAAMRCGYRHASGDILVVLDADGSNDPREIPRFVKALMEGADFVKGSRFAPSGGTTDMPRLRKFGNWGFTKMVNVLFSQTFTDLLYGFHAFWRHSLDYLELEGLDGFEVDAAIYLQAVRKKLKIVDVPSFEGFRFYGHGKLQTFPDGWRVLRTIMKEWRASLSQPETDGRVGFRSYRREPDIRKFPIIPVTGHNGGADGEGSFQLHAVGLDGLFQSQFITPPESNSQEFLPHALLEVMEEMGASSGSLVLLNPKRHVLGGYRVFGRVTYPIVEGELDDIMQQGVIGWAIEHREAVVLANTLNDPRWLLRAWEEEEKANRAAMVMPIFVGEAIAGILTLTRPADRPFTQVDLERLRNLPLQART